ncbi:MAG: class II fructose-bisphosphate aldolase [Candidatus Hydrogenedentota bacterium]
MFYANLNELWKDAGKALTIKNGEVKVTNPKALQGPLTERLAANSSVSKDAGVKATAKFLIRGAARALGIEPSSVHSLYIAVGKKKAKGGYTCPACNLRALTFESARAMFRLGKKIKASGFLFEIAKSEIGYTFQPPEEYATQILAGAIREGWKGPVFIQGDHFQINAKNFAADPEKEKASLKTLIIEGLGAGFYNIDIDSSTIVDLSKPTLEEQQRLNAEVCAEMTAFIRKNQPKGIEVSIGGEIGEVGHKNSTPEEFRAFMSEYNKALAKHGKNLKGISKISIQTGTSHGGTVLPDGSIAKVAIDFGALKTIGEIARKEYGIGGAVQHGASTLPETEFGKFVECGAIEVHLATAFQNLIFDSPNLPKDLHDRMYQWTSTNCAGERSAGQTDEQFFYKSRKKAFGPFKRDFFTMNPKNLKAVAKELEAKFSLLFTKLNIGGNASDVSKTVKLVKVPYDAVHVKEKLSIGADEEGE